MFDAWIISIVGVICLGILLEIVLPEGQTGKYVKGAFSLLVVFVVAAPLPTLFGGLKDWKPVYSGIAPDDSFIAESAEIFAEEMAAELRDELALKGYETEVKVVVKDGSLSKTERIEIILYLSVLDKEEENKHISTVRGTAAEKLSVAENKITVQVKYREADGGSA